MVPWPVEMVGRDVEQHADAGRQRGRELDLERGHLDDVDAAGRRRRQRQDGGADVAAHLHVAPAARRMWAISAVVVDLPLVPVMARKGASGAILARSRQNSSTSPMISTPAARAFSTVQCGAGCVSGMPGARTRAANARQSAVRRSATGMPALAAASRLLALSSAAATAAPPASRARQVARPERPSPNTATVRPANEVTGIMGVF